MLLLAVKPVLDDQLPTTDGLLHCIPAKRTTLDESNICVG